jgi:hypothetical protein
MSRWFVICVFGTVVVASLGFGRVNPSRSPGDDPVFCSNLLAYQQAKGKGSLNGKLNRQCIITVVNTYLIDGLEKKDADAVLLTADAYRQTFGQDNRTDAEGIREGIRNGQEDSVGEVTNVQWTIEGNQAMTYWDGIFTGDTEPGFFVAERFIIREGKIAEILIGGIQFAPDLCVTDDPCYP